MKQYKLAAWPELPAAFRGMPYRRMLHQMSQRHVSLRQLSRQSGLEHSAVRRFIETLAERNLVVAREESTADRIVALLQRWGRPQRPRFR